MKPVHEPDRLPEVVAGDRAVQAVGGDRPAACRAPWLVVSAAEDERLALATTAAQAHRSGAAAAAHQLVHGVHDEAASRRTDRVTECDAAAVHVDDVF